MLLTNNQGGHTEDSTELSRPSPRKLHGHGVSAGQTEEDLSAGHVHSGPHVVHVISEGIL